MNCQDGKQKMILQNLKKWNQGKEQPPVVMDINPTDYCNLNCLSCWQRNWKYKRLDSKEYEISDERFLSLIDEAAEIGVQKIMITGGGEALMRPVTKEVMLKIKKKNMIGEITTNGTLFTEDFIKKLVKAEWDKIVFSIDGPDAEINDSLRGKGSFNRVIKALKLFKKHKEAKANKKKPVIAFNVVLSKKNYKKLDKMIELAHKFSVDIVMFEALTIHSSHGKKLKLGKKEQDELQKFISGINKLAKKYKIVTNIDNYVQKDFISKANKMQEVISEKNSADKNFSSAPCFEPWYHLVVKVDGSVGPCCIFEEKTLNVKNMRLREIWYGSWFKKLRKDIINGKLPKWCKICNTGQVMQNVDLRNALTKQNKKKNKN